MKKTVLLVLLLVLLLIAANPTPAPFKLVRLTTHNKSGEEVYVWLKGKYNGQQYYLTLGKGDREIPMTQVFTVVTDEYLVTMSSDQSGNCVYNKVDRTSGFPQEIWSNTTWNVLECYKVNKVAEYNAEKDRWTFKDIEHAFWKLISLDYLFNFPAE